MSKILLINEGFASEFNRDEKTVSHHVTPIIFNKYEINTWLQTQSSRLKSNKRMQEFLEIYNRPINELVIVSKSYGSVETYRNLIYNYNLYFKYFKSIKWFCVDGYSLFGYGKNKAFNKPNINNLKVYNFYQRNGTRLKRGKYKGGLMGALFTNADLNWCLNATHRDIIQHPWFLKFVDDYV